MSDHVARIKALADKAAEMAGGDIPFIRCLKHPLLYIVMMDVPGWNRLEAYIYEGHINLPDEDLIEEIYRKCTGHYHGTIEDIERRRNEARERYNAAIDASKRAEQLRTDAYEKLVELEKTYRRIVQEADA